jgi:hypothetical protein
LGYYRVRYILDNRTQQYIPSLTRLGTYLATFKGKNHRERSEDFRGSL